MIFLTLAVVGIASVFHRTWQAAAAGLACYDSRLSLAFLFSIT
jgi:hypothetical protein